MIDKKQYLKNSLRWFVILSVGVIAYKAFTPSITHYNFKESERKIIRRELESAAFSVNKNSYTWKDSVTEFINAVVLSDSELQYNLALKIDGSKYDLKKLKEFNEKNLSKDFEDTTATAFFKKNNITISYNYTDTGMHPLYKIVFTPDKYK